MYKTQNGWTKDDMIAHILANFKGKSILKDDGGRITCAYRGQNGAKCAVGMFIPDNKYSKRMEGKTASYLLENNKLKMPLSDYAMDLLQYEHDRTTNMKFIEDEVCLANMINWIEDNVED